MTLLSYAMAILSGAANPAQSGANSQLNKSLEQPFAAALAVYATGLLGVALLLLFTTGSVTSGFSKASQVPWWAWLGGLLSIGSTLAGLMLARQLGAAVFTGITITSSIAMSIVLDHFGWLGFTQHTASLGRVGGAILMVLGLLLVSRT